MWEFRLVWPVEKPNWWDESWTRGVEALDRQRQEPEVRPDLYLVLPDRVDIGLKLRGGAEGDFDAKVLHARSNGWELWEKIAYFRWNSLEATRFGAMVRQKPTSDATPSNLTPTRGVKDLLRNAGLPNLEVRVEKKRIQAAARELLFSLGGQPLSPNWLAELVEIRLPERVEPLFSVCVETMDPLHGGMDIFNAAGALRCGYPELLVRYARRGL